MNIEKGKEIFYRFKGNKYFIISELGKEYRKCKIPKEIEDEWRKDIISSLRAEIAITNGQKKIEAIDSYIYFLRYEEAAIFLMEIIKNTNLDTFSLMIECEQLKYYLRVIKDNSIKNEIVKLLVQTKERMLSEDITIDEEYLNSPHLKDYDFSYDAIIERINRI